MVSIAALVVQLVMALVCVRRYVKASPFALASNTHYLKVLVSAIVTVSVSVSKWASVTESVSCTVIFLGGSFSSIL